MVDRSWPTPSAGRWSSDCGNAVDNDRENDTSAMKLVDKPLVADRPRPIWFLLPEGATDI
jgi:hypothetical protein